MVTDIKENNNEEVNRMLDCPSLCTKAFHSTYGIPCHHMIATLVEQDKQVGPEMFHKQWWLVKKEDLAKRALLVNLIKTTQNLNMNKNPPNSLNFHTTHDPPTINVRKKVVGRRSIIIFDALEAEEDGEPESTMPRHTGQEATTQRSIPSSFEVAKRAAGDPGDRVVATRRGRAPPKCSICRLAGHRKTTCPQRRIIRFVPDVDEGNKFDGIKSVDEGI